MLKHLDDLKRIENKGVPVFRYESCEEAKVRVLRVADRRLLELLALEAKKS